MSKTPWKFEDDQKFIQKKLWELEPNGFDGLMENMLTELTSQNAGAADGHGRSAARTSSSAQHHVQVFLAGVWRPALTWLGSTSLAMLFPEREGTRQLAGWFRSRAASWTPKFALSHITRLRTDTRPRTAGIDCRLSIPSYRQPYRGRR